jgi:hypothetical protein
MFVASVRFVALYEHGFSFPVSHIILGAGEGGCSHRVLAKVFRVDRMSFVGSKDIYAGNLSIVEDTIGVLSGGSMTMGIEVNPTLDAKLPKDFELLRGMKEAILAVAPLIKEHKLAHVMIAQQ